MSKFLSVFKILYVQRALKRIRSGKVHHSLGGIRLGIWKGMEMAEVIRLQLRLTHHNLLATYLRVLHNNLKSKSQIFMVTKDHKDKIRKQ